MSELQNTPGTPQGTGLAPSAAGALAYLFGAITGIVYLVIEKESRFVRFHAAQSIALTVAWVVLSIALTVLSSVLAVVPVVGGLIGTLLSLGLGLGFFVLWLLAMYRAFQGEEWEVPVLGAQARRLLPAAPVAR